MFLHKNRNELSPLCFYSLYGVTCLREDFPVSSLIRANAFNNIFILKNFQMIFDTIFCNATNIGGDFTSACLGVITQEIYNSPLYGTYFLGSFSG